MVTSIFIAQPCHIGHHEGSLPLVKGILVELSIRAEGAAIPVTPSGAHEGKGKLLREV
jgi:hypothetical protein